MNFDFSHLFPAVWGIEAGSSGRLDACTKTGINLLDANTFLYLAPMIWHLWTQDLADTETGWGRWVNVLKAKQLDNPDDVWWCYIYTCFRGLNTVEFSDAGKEYVYLNV